ncbi:MAG TPA: sigma-54-dependent Fis family transcriptional regulator [Desulfitobacterium dehalogenans]|uniref:Sigma-54-dependent Fis family transcriptional regulator n=1 Tax=Desulfitobacterium dehalogenans TaxID=36854 RepID=A0A7C7D6L5_9FIRM|nr:sigma-54-dependent Fis family transcriptional regulator [Desulfitobacterium dehalogenans]
MPQENWLRFVNGEPVVQDITPLIYRSWERSLGHNINPTVISHNKFLNDSDLRELRESREDLIRAASSVLPFLFQLLNSCSNFSILLGDKDAFILESLGEGPFLSKAQRIFLSPGGNWGEDVKGTNAIGTALVEDMPVTIHGVEHYVQENHFLTCSAVPIHELNGEVIGVIDISSEIGHQDCTLDIALTGARLIEQNLRNLTIERELKFYKQGTKLVLDLLKEGFLSVDRHGMITQINSLGASLIGLKKEDLLGRHVADVLGAPKGWFLNQDILDLRHKDSKGHEVVTHFQRISDNSGNSLGAVGVIQINEQKMNGLGWVGRTSLKSQVVLEKAHKAAQTHFSVLLQGQTGTGKEIIARMIHELSLRRNGPFIALNCAAIPSTLLESELFGYADGAFTGARRGGQPGKFELAHKGTIFLDEIGDMPLNAQVALLRLLQEKSLTRIGGKTIQKIDVRVITASHKDLKALVDVNAFRHDLFYRLKVVSIDLPPLVQRLEDLPELVTHFIHKACAAIGRPIIEIDDQIYPYFFSYSWPGNVRELENCIAGMVAMCTDSMLTVDDLPKEVRESLSEKDGSEPISMLAHQTRQMILQALIETDGKILPASRLLGISRTTLYRKMKEFNISVPKT